MPNPPNGRRLVALIVVSDIELEAVAQEIHPPDGWSVEVTLDVDAAERRLLEGGVDVVVVGLAMDSGALQRCRVARPAAMRVQVASPGEPLLWDTLAHHVLLRPVSAGALESVFDLAAGGAGLISSERLRAVVGDTRRLPMLSSSVMKLIRTIDAPNASAAAAAAVIEQDPSLAAKTLQIANSAWFGLSRRVATITQAVVLLGLGTLRTLALSSQASNLASGASAADVARLREYGMLAGQIARRIGGPHAAEAHCAATLCTIGGLLVLGRLPREYARVEAAVAASQDPRANVEAEVLGASYAQIGAWLLTLWGLPPSTTSAVAFSRTPYPHPGRGLDVAAVTFLACALADAAVAGGRAEFPPDWTLRMGIDRDLDRWRDAATQLSACWPTA